MVSVEFSKVCLESNSIEDIHNLVNQIQVRPTFFRFQWSADGQYVPCGCDTCSHVQPARSHSAIIPTTSKAYETINYIHLYLRQYTEIGLNGLGLVI